MLAKKNLLLLLLSIIAIVATAQSNKPKNILDKTAYAIRNAGDIKARFSASASTGSLNGTIYIHKSMLHLQSSNIKCWYDGQTLWTYRKSTNEVNITTPTPAEKQDINPYQFINVYKKGYSYVSKETTLRGKACYEIHLTATSPSNKLKKMTIFIDKRTYYPLRVCLQRNKSTTEINILSCATKQKFKEATFKFKKADFPGVEIIDLR